MKKQLVKSPQEKERIKDFKDKVNEHRPHIKTTTVIDQCKVSKLMLVCPFYEEGC